MSPIVVECTLKKKKIFMQIPLILLLFIFAVTALEKIVSKPGDNVTLSCIYPGREFSLDNLRVYWQIADDEDTEPCSVVHALISGQDNESLQCSQFKNRTQLLWDKLGDGNFSLLLFNVRKSDERTYRCVVMQTIEYTRVIHQEQVVLSLAGKNCYCLHVFAQILILVVLVSAIFIVSLSTY